MKKTLLIAALTLVSASAFASKARVNALQNSHTVSYDVQDIFNNPAKVTELGTLFTVEDGQNTMPGSSATTAYQFAPAAEGGFLRSENNRVWGLYLGHKSYENYTLKAITTASATPYLDQSNPIDLFYGQKNGNHSWALNLSYSQGKDETMGGENTAYGVRGGWLADIWNAYAQLGLASTGKGGAGQDYKGDLLAKVGGELDLWGMRFFADYGQASGTNASGGAAGDIKGRIDGGDIGVEHKIKSDVAHFFYGVKYTNTNVSTDMDALAGMAGHNNYWAIPLYAGIEADAASWLVLRAALSQSLVNYQEGMNLVTTARVDKTNYYDTMATLGAGLKFNKLIVDGLLSAGSTGNLNFNDGNGTNNFMSQASATYYF